MNGDRSLFSKYAIVCKFNKSWKLNEPQSINFKRTHSVRFGGAVAQLGLLVSWSEQVLCP